MLLRPNPKDKLKLFEALRIGVNFDGQRVNVHGIQLFLLDARGLVAKTYHTLIWDNHKVLQDLKKLTAENISGLTVPERK